MFRSFSILVGIFLSITFGLYGAAADVARPWFMQASSQCQPLPTSFVPSSASATLDTPLASYAGGSVRDSVDTRTLCRSAASTNVAALTNGDVGGEASSAGEDSDFPLWDGAGAGSIAEEHGSASSVLAAAAWDSYMAGAVAPVLGVPAGMSPDKKAPSSMAAADDASVSSAAPQQDSLGKAWNTFMKGIVSVGKKGGGGDAPAPTRHTLVPDSGFSAVEEQNPDIGARVRLEAMADYAPSEAGSGVRKTHIPLPTGDKLYKGLEWYEYFDALYAQQRLTLQRRADMRFLLIIEKPSLKNEDMVRAFIGGLGLFAMEVPNVLLGCKEGDAVVAISIDIACMHEKLWGSGT